MLSELSGHIQKFVDSAKFIQIVIPMAGRGSRFSTVSHTNPKPLIQVLDHPMIDWVVNNLKTNLKHKFIFVCQKSHDVDFGLGEILGTLAPNSEVVLIDHVTDGAAQTVLKAEGVLDPEMPLVIANCDQYISNADFSKFYELTCHPEVDGVILTMAASDPKWSFVKLDDSKKVIEVREKEVISNIATVGIYSFGRAGDFIKMAHRMIDAQDRQKGEYYVAPVYNSLVAEGKNIQIMDVGNLGETSQMFGLGTPEDLAEFVQSDTAITEEKRIF